MFAADVVAELSKAAKGAGLEPAALLAIAEVESGGSAYAEIAGRREPVIRFEGHYFDARLSEEDRATAREQGLASPRPGAVANPAGQQARWTLVERAAAIDAKAAYESVSWGLGQVMGAHWAWLGYASVAALAEEARSGPAGQARLMLRYVEKAGLVPALKARDWAAVARGYNGPGFAAGGYDRKIAAAYRRYAARAIAPVAPDVPLRRGASGDAVRAVQQRLAARGFKLEADGSFGARTEAALRAFQHGAGLAVDGIAGPATLAALGLTGEAPVNWLLWLWRWLSGRVDAAATTP